MRDPIDNVDEQVFKSTARKTQNEKYSFINIGHIFHMLQHINT